MDTTSFTWHSVTFPVVLSKTLNCSPYIHDSLLIMTRQVFMSLLNKAQTGNELLEIIDAFANELEEDNNTVEQ